jgi:hypothetical protein
MLWRYGYLDSLFGHIGYEETLDFYYRKVKAMPRYNNVKIDDIIKYSDALLGFLNGEVIEVIHNLIDEEEEVENGFV